MAHNESLMIKDGTEPSTSNEVEKTAEMGMLINETDDTKGGDGSEIFIPESTHSFLFTEPLTSFPFLSSLLIVIMSFVCLCIAFIDNIRHLDIPANVALSVRVAQYMAILIALMMEEEIPTAVFLLKRISKPLLKSKFPEISYWRFVASSILRFSLGYLFLINVYAIVIRASSVLEIFYDVLALQFLQQLDDIAFGVAKIEVLGKRLYLATMTPYFTSGFERRNDRLSNRRRTKFFLKGVYIVNLIVFLALMINVSVKQMHGFYSCPSYTVTIGSGKEVWEDAYVNYPENSVRFPGGKSMVLPLLFSYFNGVYVMDSERSSEGRPIYTEMAKSNRLPFDNIVPEFDTSVMPFTQLDPIKPAEFRYCGGRWMLVHDYIKKHETEETSECGSWLLRSQEYDGFDLGGAAGTWQIWEGQIGQADVSLSCNWCHDNADCNLNGVCNSQRKCECKHEEGTLFFGEHCEVKLKDSCRNITHVMGEGKPPALWSADNSAKWIGFNGIFQEYSRPVYIYVEGLSPEYAPAEDDKLALVYTGSRYFIQRLIQAKNNATNEYWKWAARNYHGFWTGAYDPSISFIISEPTDSDTPVGVDFFWVGEQDEQYGPFGELTPTSEYPDHGLFRCDVTKTKECSFCENGIADPTIIIPQSNGTTCGTLEVYSVTLKWNNTEENADACTLLRIHEEVCCPEAVNTSSLPSSANSSSEEIASVGNVSSLVNATGRN